MPFDREGTLRKAEKLLRQGKLDLAIAEYRSVIEDQPTDWNTANALGDLYFRAGQVDKAVAEYGRIGDHLASQGFFPKAGALYKKILKIKPDDEQAMWSLGRLAARQGLLVEARSQFLSLAQRRHARGDRRGEAEARIQIGDLGGADLETRLAGARARVELGQTGPAVEQLGQIAADLREKGKEDEALAVLSEAANLTPDDADLRGSPGGDTSRAAEILAPEIADSDPTRLWTRAEMELRAGHLAEGTALLRRILRADPGRRDALVSLGCAVAEVNADAGYECVEIAARAAIAADEWKAAAAAFSAFVERVPNHIPALMWLVEICVDGGLDAPMRSAQTQLADAYLAIGAGVEARLIAEDLVAREPRERAHIERFRRALALVGETDIEAIIAERLSGESALLGTDFLGSGEPRAPAAASPSTPVAEPDLRSGPEPATEPSITVSKKPHPSLHAIDLSGILGDEATLGDEAAPHDAPSRAEAHEIDLSTVLGDLKGPATGTTPPASLENILKVVREEAVLETSSPDTVEQQFQLATTYIEMGVVDEAINALEVAARSMRHRFRAGALLAKLHMDQGDTARAIEWFERAAEAPAPTPAAAHQLLYELASVLEVQGESERSLAVFLELQAEAGDYRDLAIHLEYLTNLLAG